MLKRRFQRVRHTQQKARREEPPFFPASLLLCHEAPRGQAVGADRLARPLQDVRTYVQRASLMTPSPEADTKATMQLRATAEHMSSKFAGSTRYRQGQQSLEKFFHVSRHPCSLKSIIDTFHHDGLLPPRLCMLQAIDHLSHKHP